MQILDVLKEKLRKQMNDYCDDLATGEGVSDFSDYKYLTGRIAGLALAEYILNELAEAVSLED